MKVEIQHPDGRIEMLDGKDVLIFRLKDRPVDIVALEEVMRVLRNCTKSEAQRILTYVADVTDRRSV